jgi:hypothetical protein
LLALFRHHDIVIRHAKNALSLKTAFVRSPLKRFIIAKTLINESANRKSNPPVAYNGGSLYFLPKGILL